MHRHFKHIEDVIFEHKNIILTKLFNFDFDISHCSLQYILNVMEGHGWGRGQGIRTDLGHRGITCVLQMQFSSFKFFKC